MENKNKRSDNRRSGSKSNQESTRRPNPGTAKGSSNRQTKTGSQDTRQNTSNSSRMNEEPEEE